MNYLQRLTERLAKQFSVDLLKCIGAESMARVVTKNKTAEYTDACASHDYCDANMVMIDSWRTIMKRGHRMNSDDDLSLWNNAWTLAKQNSFYQS